MNKNCFLSVLIATFNRADILKTTLDAFCNLDTKDFCWELLVVDNNSSDRTRDVTETYSNKLPVRYLFEAQQGKNYALNSGIKMAKGHVLVFTDDDVTPAGDWLAQIYQSTLRWPNAELFGGMVIPNFPPNTPEWIKNASFSGYVFAIHKLNQSEGFYPVNRTPSGPNCWIRREIFDKGTRYSPHIGPRGKGRIAGSETELFLRLNKMGILSIYIPSAKVFHRIQKKQTTTSYLLRRSYAGGRGWAKMNEELDVKRIANIPRHLFRYAFEDAVKACMHVAKLDFKASFEAIMKLFLILGSIRQNITVKIDESP